MSVNAVCIRLFNKYIHGFVNEFNTKLESILYDSDHLKFIDENHNDLL